MDWINAIQTVGLPTAMLLAMGFWFYKKDQEHRADFLNMIREDKEDRNKREDRYAILAENVHRSTDELSTIVKTFIEITKK